MRKLFVFLFVAVFAAFCLLSGNASANLISNGSFEDGYKVGFNNSYKTVYASDTSITNWVVGGVGVDWHNNYELNAPQNGALLVDLNLGSGSQTGTLSQSFATVANALYSLKFWLAGPDYESTVNVNVAGQDMQFSQAGSNVQSLIWGEKTFDFMATGATTTLTFSNPDGNGYYWGPLLDNVSVEQSAPAPVPVPAALLLLGPGLAGLAAMRKRLNR